ncbi:hypothetical protein [Dethiothermospora halolimnae]|uniref:hypothetical protein n=1 Tax=Dethiothermospora halolimnae TaxID=3114390 RepID=UPI003CCC3D4D
METTYIESTFEKLIPNKLPYNIFWVILSVLTYCISELILFLFHEDRYFVFQLLIIGGVLTWPIFYRIYSKKFYDLFKDIKAIFWENDNDANEWYVNNSKRIFALNTIVSKLLVLLLMVLGILTLIYLGLPFNNTSVNVMAVIGFLVIYFIAINSVNIMVQMFITLYKLSELVPKVGFYRYSHPAFLKIKKLYLEFGVVTSIIYFGLVLSFNCSPYNMNLVLLAWLSSIAILPLGMYVCASLLSKKIILKAREYQTDKIDSKIESQYKKLEKEADMDDIIKLKNYMDIKNNLLKYQITQNKINSIFALIIAFISLVSQIITIIKGLGIKGVFRG